MAVKRRVVGGVLAGLGNALASMGENRIRRRQRDEDLDAQRAWEMQKLQMQQLSGLSDKIAADPLQANSLLQGASINPLLSGLNLSRMKPADPALALALRQKIATAKDATDIPNVEDAATRAGMDTTPIPAADPSQAAGAQFMDPSMPATTFEQTNPTIRPVAQAAIDRRNQLQQADENKLALTGRTEFAKNYAQASGTNTAANENAPAALAQKVTEAEALGPVIAQNAGLTAGATFDAQNTPDRQQAAARAAGMEALARARASVAPDVVAGEVDKASRIAGAQQQAQTAKAPTDQVRQTVSFFVRATNAGNNATTLEDQNVSPANAGMPLLLQTQMSRKYNAAVSEFALSVLRKESGAAIAPTELANFASTYFAQRGDSPDVIKAKQEARARVLDGLKYEATPGLADFESQGNTVPTVTQPGSTLNKLLKGPR